MCSRWVPVFWSETDNSTPPCPEASRPSRTNHEPTRNCQKPSRPVCHRRIANTSGGPADVRWPMRMGAGFASSLPRSHASGAGVGDALSRSLRIVAPLDLAGTGLVGRTIGFSAACGGV
jgi:hypothetical protein